MAEIEDGAEKASMKDEGRSKDVDPCPICLGSFLQEAYLDRCFHKFCYKCILNWSIYMSRQSSKSQSALACPLCKGINYSIVYGYDGTSFQQHYINQDPPKQSIFFSKAHRLRLQSYYREPGTIYDKFNIPKYWKYRRYLQLNKWLQSWLKREMQALTQEENVDIIVHHILGVIESFVRLSQRECSSDITPEQKRQEFKALISDAAKPFLTGRTEHFVNEMGMGSALDTLCGQSYGAKQYHMLGIHMQRGMFVLLLVTVPLAFIWANTGCILIAVGQDPEISAEAGVYARYMIPCLFAYGLLQCHIKFLQTQNIVFPMMISSAITALLHFLVCWILVFKAGLGIRGAAMASSISYWINLILLVFYVKYSGKCERTWTGFSKEALNGILNFIRLAIPSAIMLCLELWSFELTVLLSGLLPNPKLETSVLSICLNTCALLWMIPTGFGGAVSTRVSNELGAGHPQAARVAVQVVFVLAVTEGILIGAIMILVRHIWGSAFSNEKEVVDYVASMLPILAVSNFFDGLQSALSGAARGCGWQDIGAFVNLGSYYLVGIPSAVLLAFVLHVGGKGLWIGIICALLVQNFSLLIIILHTNWEQEVKRASERVYDAAVPVTMVS